MIQSRVSLLSVSWSVSMTSSAVRFSSPTAHSRRAQTVLRSESLVIPYNHERNLLVTMETDFICNTDPPVILQIGDRNNYKRIYFRSIYIYTHERYAMFPKEYDVRSFPHHLMCVGLKEQYSKPKSVSWGQKEESNPTQRILGQDGYHKKYKEDIYACANDS